MCHAGGNEPRSGRNTSGFMEKVCAAVLKRALGRVDEQGMDVVREFRKFCPHCTMLLKPCSNRPSMFLKSVHSTVVISVRLEIVASCSQPSCVASSFSQALSRYCCVLCSTCCRVPCALAPIHQQASMSGVIRLVLDISRHALRVTHH